MKSTRLNRRCIAAVAVLALGLSTAASAQYVWLTENGVKHYSDTPPPSSVPKNRILKQPGNASPVLPQKTVAPAEAASDGEKAVSAAATRDKAPMTIAEKNAEFQKRKIEQAEKEKKAAEQEKLAADKMKHCDQAKAYHRTLDSGQRVGRTDRNGERYYLNDAERAREIQETRKMLDDCK
jgi:hypothetical protein